MREEIVRKVKSEIQALLEDHLYQERTTPGSHASWRIDLESLDSQATVDPLLCEIRVVLSVLAGPWQCRALIDGIYEALRPHHLSDGELRLVLMSLHVEVCRIARGQLAKRATIRYLLEEACDEDDADLTRAETEESPA